MTRDRRDLLLEQVSDRPDARLELAELYRSLGHIDQAARWGISVDGWARNRELDAYTALIRQQKPDPQAMLRRLSRFSVGEELTNDASAIIARASSTPVGAPGWRDQVDFASRWTSGVSAAMGATVVVVMMVGLFVAAFAGEQDLRLPARVTVVVCSLCFALAAAFRLPASTLRRQWIRVALLAVATLILGAVVAILAPQP